MTNTDHNSNFSDESIEPRLTALFVKGVEEQDKAALDEFMGLALPELTKRVARRCDKRGHSGGFAEIVASVTLMKALHNAGKFDATKNVMWWLVGIARRELSGCYRDAQRIDRREGRDEEAGHLSPKDDELNKLRGRNILTPLEELVRREDETRRMRQNELLDVAIPSLPELKRRVLELYRSGNTPGVIAVELGLTPARVYKLLFDAKQELRRRLA